MKIMMSEITILNDQTNMREDALLWNISDLVTVLNNIRKLPMSSPELLYYIVA